MSKRDARLYIEDVKNSIGKIEKYTKNLSFDDFKNNDQAIDAVVRNLEVIGEAIGKIYDYISDDYPGIPWREIIGMRNKIAHEYFGIDEEVIWGTVKNNLPDLKKEISKIEL